MEQGICTEDVECNLRGEIIILILFVIPISSVCKFVIPSKDEHNTYRLLILIGITVQQIGLQNEGRITSDHNSYSGALEFWNSIPAEIKSATTINSFVNKCLEWMKEDS